MAGGRAAARTDNRCNPYIIAGNRQFALPGRPDGCEVATVRLESRLGRAFCTAPPGGKRAPRQDKPRALLVLYKLPYPPKDSFDGDFRPDFSHPRPRRACPPCRDDRARGGGGGVLRPTGHRTNYGRNPHRRFGKRPRRIALFGRHRGNQAIQQQGRTGSQAVPRIGQT